MTPPDTDVALGLAAYEAGRFEEANDRLSRALDRVGVPTLALYAARTHEKLGHWVKASELYLLAARISPKSAANVAQLQAQYEAEREREQLLARIPRLTLVLDGEDLESVEVSLDGLAVPKGLIGANQLVDPGHHVIRAARDGQLITGELDLVEQQHKTTRLHFARRESMDAQAQELPSISTTTTRQATTATRSASAAVNPVARGSASDPTLENRDPLNAIREARASNGATSQAQRDASADPDQTLRTLGWVGVGLGGTGILVGALTGLMAMSARSDFRAAGCEGNLCPADQADDVDRYNRLRRWSTVSFGAGGLFSAAGLALILIASNGAKAPRASLSLGLGAATWSGSF